ncbi:hypothetical protein DND90_26685 [Pseudomonas syringae pv. maculicola]|nr:hypothetical protein DND90_26685 [Pseudomonas syringae pv. maculicola]
MAAILVPNYGGLEDREMPINKPTSQGYPRFTATSLAREFRWLHTGLTRQKGYRRDFCADSTTLGHSAHDHLDTHSKLTWTPAPRPLGQAVGAQRRRFALLV